MAVFTRINGDAAGVAVVDAGRSFANAAVINTGIAAPLSAYKITLAASTAGGGYGNLAAELTTGGAVETLVRYFESNASVLAYQVDAGTSGASILSILAERSGWVSDTSLQNFIISNAGTAATGANIGATGNIWTGGITVSSSGGLKLF